MLKVTPVTISAWMRDGCPYVSIGKSAVGQGRRPRFELERVMAWLESRTEAGKQENANGKELAQ